MKDSMMKLGILGLLILAFKGLNAQDPQFSQFYNSSIYYNPAAAGISRDLRIFSSYRNLWSRVPGDLSTYFLAVDYQLSEKNIGIGLLALNDNEGIYNLRTNRVELIYSYRLQTRHKLLQFGISIFSINIRDYKNDAFIFSDQLDPIHGVVQQSSFIQDEIETVVYPDWNVGFIYKQNLTGRKATPTIGFSASHIFRPNISFLNSEVRLPIKYVLHANFLTRITINGDDVWKRKFALLNPGFIYEYQKPFQTFTVGSSFDVYPLRFGMWFRNRSFFSEVYKFNSVVFHAGIVIPVSLKHDLMIDYSYDSTISKLELGSGGAHEITLIYNITFPEKKHSVSCFNEWWKVGKF